MEQHELPLYRQDAHHLRRRAARSRVRHRAISSCAPHNENSNLNQTHVSLHASATHKRSLLACFSPGRNTRSSSERVASSSSTCDPGTHSGLHTPSGCPYVNALHSVTIKSVRNGAARTAHAYAYRILHVRRPRGAASRCALTRPRRTQGSPGIGQGPRHGSAAARVRAAGRSTETSNERTKHVWHTCV